MSADLETTPADSAERPSPILEKVADSTDKPTIAAPGVAIPAVQDNLAAPLKELAELLPAITASTSHSEVWGVELTNPVTSVPTQIVLQKYLNANDGNVTKAKEQLIKTLEWRAKMKPLEMVQAKYSKEKFGGLGYVTVYEGDAEKDAKLEREIFTWNIYGGVKNIDGTFGNIEQFIAWRVALMERALQDLALSTATKPITATYDPYKIIQVHDYKNISFLRQSPAVKNASKTTIEVFATNYPELLKEKFFINVPAIMGFVYGMIKVFVAEKTRKKFHPMSNGGALAGEFGESQVKDLGAMLPTIYGGKGKDLAEVGQEPELE